MGSESEKAVIEVAIFRKFASLAPFSIEDSTIRKCYGEREPDILCEVQGEGPVAFELVEICDPALAKSITNAFKGKTTGAFWSSDPSIEIVKRNCTSRILQRSQSNFCATQRAESSLRTT